VTLDAWSPWDGNPADFDQRKAALREVHPQITINWTGTGFGTYLDKVTAAVASGTPHDLWFEFVKLGQARPVFPDRTKVDRENLNPQLNAIWTGEATPRTAAQAAAKQLNDVFAANPQQRVSFRSTRSDT
jgi:ABC-type glycerol-3-phosphate transport system substrate-binding protein